MLKFFRQIRKTLIRENQMKNYFVYAFGEILLVIVGILLALQINNWNEGRKDRLIEAKTLSAIHKDLEEDDRTINLAIERFGLSLFNIERIFQPEIIPDDSLAYIYTRASGIMEFLPLTTAFDRSMSSGKFDLIREDSIAQLIQRLYAFDYKTIGETEKRLNLIADELKDLTTKYEAFDVKPVQRSANYYDQIFVLPWNIENLKRRNRNPQVKAVFRQAYTNIRFLIISYQDIQKKNRAVRKNIERYLKTF